MADNYIVIENKAFCLKINEFCQAVSLLHKATGEECISKGNETALFSITEDRPYNNEIKLAHPNKRTVFQANRVRKEGDKLIVGFELITFEAVVSVKNADNYIAFTLDDFNCTEEDFKGLDMTPPPVAEFRLMQLPIIEREKFGEWLNVSMDDKLAVNVLATSPHVRIDSLKMKDHRIMTADAVRGIKLKGATGVLVVSETNKLLDVIDAIEEDYDLPRGVKSRRADTINRSAYWSDTITPENVDEHISYAKQMGFRMMLINYKAIFDDNVPDMTFPYCSDYDYRKEYLEGVKSLRKMLKKIKDAGITPGLHILHTHVGIRGKYVTPVADHRLNLTRHFTLAKALGENDDTIYVEQNPEGCVMHEKCRVLKFNGELIHYDSYTTEWPYSFKGCKRGHFGTNIRSHELGTIGGILDISEYGAASVYIDQNTSLQDEIADKIASAYSAGFEYIYFDGSEGTNAPYEFHVPNAQYRVYKKLNPAPLYCEGAAKSHFSWHMLSGGNAFDVFPTNVFKEKIAQHPLEEAPRMANDFTRLNFGWWSFRKDIQPDHYEYGSSRAAAWDCPVTMMAHVDAFKENPRANDVFEVTKRWEDVRAKKWLTKEHKEMLKSATQEHILIVNECGEYELLPYDQIKMCANGDERVSAFVFERNGKTNVVVWHTTGAGKLYIPDMEDAIYLDEIGGNNVDFEEKEGGITIPIDDRKYLVSALSKEEVIKAFENAKIIE